MTSGRITFRLVAPAMVYWSFVPLVQIASLAIVCRNRPPEMPFRRTVDLFLRSNWPLLLWLLLFSAAWACFPAASVIPWWSYRSVQFGSAGVALAITARLDYRFLRRDLKRTPRDAVLQLVAQRLLSWTPILLIFVAPAAWEVVASELGL